MSESNRGVAGWTGFGQSEFRRIMGRDDKVVGDFAAVPSAANEVTHRRTAVVLGNGMADFAGGVGLVRKRSRRSAVGSVATSGDWARITGRSNPHVERADVVGFVRCDLAALGNIDLRTACHHLLFQRDSNSLTSFRL